MILLVVIVALGEVVDKSDEYWVVDVTRWAFEFTSGRVACGFITVLYRCALFGSEW